MAFAEDLSIFVDTDDFAVTASWNSGTVNCIFDADYVPVSGEYAHVESEAPVALCVESDVTAAAHGQTFTVNGTAYVIRGIHPNGTGLVRLVLQAPS